MLDGIKVFPHRGKAPKIPEGYERDPGNPYIFYKVVQECPKRVINQEKTCCGICVVWRCEKKVINRGTCIKCNGT